jgi:uncharacterized protein YdeI (YjbR/CyaY-like superfamily)
MVTQPEIPFDHRRAPDQQLNARRVFEGLAPSYQREFLMWIDEATRPATRRRRIDATSRRPRR